MGQRILTRLAIFGLASLRGIIVAVLTDIQIRHPFIVADRGEGVYRLYGTSSLGGRTGAPQGFVVRQSRDLKNWSEPKSVLSRITGPQEADYYRAPEVHGYAGRWYLFGSFGHGVSILKPQARYTQIFAADSPDGPFVAHSDGPVTPLGWMGVTGTLHVDREGRPWLVFCREWVQTRDGEVHAMPLTTDLRRSAGDSRLLFRASDASWSHAQDSNLGKGYRVAEGPWLHRTAAGTLLMLWSSFGFGKYLTGVARSTSGEVTGPWVQSSDPLYPHNGGHAMLFRTFDDRLFMVLHAPNIVGEERARFRLLKETGDDLELV